MSRLPPSTFIAPLVLTLSSYSSPDCTFDEQELASSPDRCKTLVVIDTAVIGFGSASFVNVRDM